MPKIGLAEFGDRYETVEKPLAAVGIETTRDTDSADVILLGRRKVEYTNEDTPVYYRLRGDLWAVRDGYNVRAWVGDRIRNRQFAGLIAPDKRLQAKLEAHRFSRFQPECHQIPLAIEADGFPTTEHTDTELRCLTLTNCDYQAKIAPLMQLAPVVERALEGSETWRICGKGDYAPELKARTEALEHVEFWGFQGTNAMLDWANCLLHFSNADIQRPNAILEGMAANLPVLVNDYEAFTGDAQTIRCGTSEMLERELRLQRNPERRQNAVKGYNEALALHTPEAIGKRLYYALSEVHT